MMKAEELPETVTTEHLCVLCDPSVSWSGLLKAVAVRFGVVCEVALWRNYSGYIRANVSIDSRVSKRARRDMLTFIEGFVAARGGKIE